MRLIEQALFSSIENGDGYQVVARSPGVCPSDVRELCAWGPTQDSILDPSGEAASFNFHPLPSGYYCISRTVLAGRDEGRGAEKRKESRPTAERPAALRLPPSSFPSRLSVPPRADTHCLLLPPEVLARFSNNPFALIDAASKGGLWQMKGAGRAETGEAKDEGGSGSDESQPSAPSTVNPAAACRLPPTSISASRPVPRPSLLASLSLEGGAAAADPALLERLAADPGPDTVAALLQAAREAVCLAIAGATDVASLMAGLFHCLPVECRLEFSFTTGLKFSPRRPFRIVAAPDDLAGRQWLANHPNVVVLDVAKGKQGAGLISAQQPSGRCANSDPSRCPPAAAACDGWSQLVRRALLGGQAGFLAAHVSRRRFRLTLADLPALGLELLEELDRLGRGGGRAEPGEGSEGKDQGGRRAAKGGSSLGLHPSSVSASLAAPLSPCAAHAAHRRFAKGAEGEGSKFPERPAARFADVGPLPFHPGPNSPDMLAKLEELDDLVYGAINGHQEAIERLEAAWPKLAAELDEDLLTASREQYLRYALSVWDQCLGADGLRQPGRAVAAVEVLCVLFGDAS